MLQRLKPRQATDGAMKPHPGQTYLGGVWENPRDAQFQFFEYGEGEKESFPLLYIVPIPEGSKYRRVWYRKCLKESIFEHVCKKIPLKEHEKSPSVWYKIIVYSRHLAVMSLSPDGVLFDKNHTVIRRSQW